MDQLKLVLEHKFWILAGLAILLPPIGWWAATDILAKETSERDQKIAEYDRKLSSVKDVPNEKWIEGEKRINGELSESVSESQEHLFDHQKSAMTFPPIVREALAKCKVKYRGDGGATQDFLDARDFFVQKYVEDWKNAVNLIQPYKLNTGEGLVLLPVDAQVQEVSPITRHFEVEQWRQTLVFSAEQMWDVQEDVWFLRALMQAIARVNQGTTDIGNARIKKVNEAILRGGDVTDLAARRSGKSASTATAGKPAGGPFGGGGALFGGRGSSGPEAGYKGPKPFDADDVFGGDGSKMDSGSTARVRKGEGSGAPLVNRWVDSGPKWRKRGFVLKLVMDEREIPTLLAALSESAFPVEILHVEHAAHTGGLGAGTPHSPTVNPVNAPTGGVDSPELTPEQQAQQRKIAESLRMAFNMHYLADVIVAGTLTIYNEPKATASKSVAALPAGANRAPAGAPPSTGEARNAKTALPGGGPAKPVPAASKATSNPSRTAAQPTKSGTPASVPSKETKMIPVGVNPRTAGK